MKRRVESSLFYKVYFHHYLSKITSFEIFVLLASFSTLNHTFYIYGVQSKPS